MQRRGSNALLKCSLGMNSRVLPPCSLLLATDLSDLGNLYEAQGHMVEAEPRAPGRHGDADERAVVDW